MRITGLVMPLRAVVAGGGVRQTHPAPTAQVWRTTVSIDTVGRSPAIQRSL